MRGKSVIRIGEGEHAHVHTHANRQIHDRQTHTPTGIPTMTPPNRHTHDDRHTNTNRHTHDDAHIHTHGILAVAGTPGVE